jgi:hypothetical protein
MKHIKSINICVGLLAGLMMSLSFVACNDEWKDEQYEKYVSFVKSGYQNIYLNYNVEGGKVTYRIPIEISGSTKNDRDVQVTIAVDPDTLDAMNKARYYLRDDLFFRQLDPKYYTFQTMQTTIPAGSDIGYIDVDFEFDDLDLVEKHILPLCITSTSEYTPSPVKWYKRSLMRIVLFNDYSGSYAATGGQINIQGDDNSTSVETREMRVVDQNTVFFYAGLTEEEARDRASYKIRATFEPLTQMADSGAVTLVADSAAIGFTSQPDLCYYKVEKHMDELQPYLQIQTTTMFLRYSYDDITNPAYKVRYNFSGSYLLERRRNTQIPEQDQQEIFEW